MYTKLHKVNMKSTIVTSPLSEEILKRNQKTVEAWEAAVLIINSLLDAYKDGEIGFEHYCKSVDKILNVELIKDHSDKTFGKFIRQALACAPNKKKWKRSNSPTKWIRIVCGELCVLVSEKEGRPINRHAENNALERVVEIMKDRGISVTVSVVERGYKIHNDENENKKRSNKKLRK